MTHGTFNDSFKPALWLPDGHSQTLWRRFSGAAFVAHRRERIELADGDFIDLDWAIASKPGADDQTPPESPVVLVVHGLCGCSESSYVLALQKELLDAEITSVVMNLRGCSGESNRKARSYHSGTSDDLAAVVAHLKNQYPGKEIIVVAYSLGANVMLKWLGETASTGTSPLPLKAVAVSTPFTLALCSQAMLKGFSRIYGRYFTRRLLADLARKKQSFLKMNRVDELAKLESLAETDAITSIWEFDDCITAPLHGFSSATDYYQQCSSINFLSAIKTQTLLVQAYDDPMIPPAALPQPQDLPANVRLELYRKGGHVGFVAGLGQRWLEKRILQYIQR